MFDTSSARAKPEPHRAVLAVLHQRHEFAVIVGRPRTGAVHIRYVDPEADPRPGRLVLCGPRGALPACATSARLEDQQRGPAGATLCKACVTIAIADEGRDGELS